MVTASQDVNIKVILGNEMKNGHYTYLFDYKKTN